MIRPDFNGLPLTDGQREALYYVGLLVVEQHKKWGQQNHTDDVWAAINGEELGEAAEATRQRGVILGKFEMSSAVFALEQVGEACRDTLEAHFDNGVDKTRRNTVGTAAEHEVGPASDYNLDREIGQTASVAVDWLASRIRNGRSSI